jgi:hypothetical protein
MWFGLAPNQNVHGGLNMMTKVTIEIPEYNSQEGLRMSWEDDFTIHVRIEGTQTVVIQANTAGLISLARQLLTLAQDEVPPGYHIHYDESNALEDGSCEIILEKRE